MPDSIGTRTPQNIRRIRPDQGRETRTHQQDKGMSKRLVATLTFTASDGRITGANGDFSAFRVGDPLLVQGTNLNNGHKTVTGLDASDAAYVTVDPPPKDENAVASTLVRTA